LQLLAHDIRGLDAVLYTHDHADHIHGIDDLRVLSLHGAPLALYGPPETLAQLRVRFRYIFDDGVVPPPGTSKPQLTLVPVEPFEELRIGGMRVVPVEVDHGGTRVYGYRIGSLAYVTDAKEVGGRAREVLRGVRVLVLNALFERPHSTHLSIPEAIDLAREVGAARTLLTHLSHRYSHAELAARLPPGVEPAYDGMIVEL
jgi:phosphoribosyl 1,2-cyclic phosphate phosphodiesterase